ncbi:hypothetical protein BJ878DRAFT_483445 [Calycina marina]|uniref:CCHC-type domain-containing protein n=1 Tax=Calycina marina TaxID=1763456 RepID=A0A9P7YW80_9HELO|nr:hypothetical protein BJ878DRAFT_483445 [Calycina marina]
MGSDHDIVNIPVLTKENHDDWFRDMEIELRGKGTFIEKMATYDEKEAKAVPRIFKFLRTEDKALYNSCGVTALEFWKKLKSNYKEADQVLAARFMGLIQGFSMTKKKGSTEQFTIREAWHKLNEYRRKPTAADFASANTYSDNMLYMIFIKTLEKAGVWESTIDSVQAQHLTPAEKLKLIEEKEQHKSYMVDDDRDTEMGMKASDVRDRSRRGGARSFGGKQNRNTSPKEKIEFIKRCHLCQSGHYVKNCAHLSGAREYVEAVKNSESAVKKKFFGEKSLLNDADINKKEKAQEECRSHG